MEITSDSGEYVTYEVKPQLKTLGPRYGAFLGKVRGLLAECPDEIVAALRKEGSFRAELEGREVELKEEDLLITARSKEGFASESDGETTVVLDTALDEALILEGAEREIVSKIQTMRKEAGFEVTDHIVVGYNAEGVAKKVLDSGSFRSDVLCDAVTESLDGYTKEWDINGDNVTISVSKAG